MKRPIVMSLLFALMAGCSTTSMEPAKPQASSPPPAAPVKHAAATKAPAASHPAVVPVPPIATHLGVMAGVDELPAKGALPDPLLEEDGQHVTTVAQWEQRRNDIKTILEFYATGLAPPPPGNVEGTELESVSVLGGNAHYRLVHLMFGPEGKLGFDIGILTPKGKGPFPTIIVPGGPPPGSKMLATMPHPDLPVGEDALSLPLGVPKSEPKTKPATLPSSMPAPKYPYRAGSGMGILKLKPPTASESAADNSETLYRGYAVVMFNYQDCGEDTRAREMDGSWAFRQTRFFPAYPNNDWGLALSWAWGVSRVVDYLETQSFVDKDKIIATGHSRVGKAILIAGAYDDRISLVAPAGSAGGGVGVYRFSGAGRGGGEGLEDMMKKYPNWFSPHLYQFRGHVDQLPFDQHWFVALCAPRPFIALEGLQDKNGKPNAIKQSEGGAKPVYALYGAANKLGVNFANHPHQFADADWDALLDFADQQLLGKKVHRDFHHFPSP